MAKDIALKIYMPGKVVLDDNVYRVVLPCTGGNTLTIIDRRAPSIVALDMGAVQILDENNSSVREFYISGGMADVKNNVCEILTEAAFDKSDLNKEIVEEMNREFPNPFYKWLVDKFK